MALIIGLRFVFCACLTWVLCSGLTSPTTDTSLKKFAIITGCSPSSIGFEAAKELANPPYDYNVILACRNEEKGKAAEHKIQSKNPKANVKYLPLDLSSFDSIHDFVQDIQKDPEFSKYGLSLLVNNAGIGFGTSKQSTMIAKTKDGLEELVGVNHFGHFLLTNLLLNDIKRCQDTDKRIVVVASSPPRKDIAPEEEGGPEKLILPSFPDGILQESVNEYSSKQAYRVSKLCNIWFAKELQRQLSSNNINNNITINAICPGFVPRTGLARKMGIMAPIFVGIAEPLRWVGIGKNFIRSKKDGAKSIVAACVGETAKTGGQYLHLPLGATDLQPDFSSAEVQDGIKAKQLWEISERICKIKQ